MPRKRKPAPKKPAPKKKPQRSGGLRSGALNLTRTNGPAKQVADLKRALANADIVSVNEVFNNDAALRWAKRNGYGVYHAKGRGADSAIVWNKSQVRLRPGSARSVALNKLEGKAGGARTRYAAYAQFEDINTGRSFWQIAAHTVPMGRGNRDLRSRIRDEQYETLATLARGLATSAPVLLAGDLNGKHPAIAGLQSDRAGKGIMHVMSGNGLAVKNTRAMGGLNSDKALVVSNVGFDGDGPKLGEYGWMPDALKDADIIGGPGHRPTKPVRADYEPGGKYYGLMAYSVAQQHYQHAMDAFKHGYWYHSNGLAYTKGQAKFNQNYAAKGGKTKFGIPTSSYANIKDSRGRGNYTLENGEWKYHVAGGGAGGPGGGKGGGPKPLPVPGGMEEYRKKHPFTPPTFTGFSEGDLGGGPMQIAPGAPPKQNGAPLYAGLPAAPGMGPEGLETPAPSPSTPPTPEGTWGQLLTRYVGSTEDGPGGDGVLTGKPIKPVFSPGTPAPVGPKPSPFPVRPDINPETTQQMMKKVSGGFFLGGGL